MTVTALNHFEVRSVSRSTGRSAVAAAAYRSGEELYDDRNGGSHDYTRRTERHEILASFIAVPDGAEWAQHRETLWNAAEWAEKRKDAKTAREYIVALPQELDVTQRRALMERFAGHLVERYRVAVDVNLHAPSEKGDQRNHHAHVLTTTRRIDATGLLDKTRELDVKTTSVEEIRALRQHLSDLTNLALEEARSERRVDPRSHKERGIEEAPQRKDGPVATEYRRRSEQVQAEGREGEVEAQAERPAQGRSEARQRRSADEVRAEIIAKLEAKMRELERQIAAEWARLREAWERAAAALERRVAEARERLGAVAERFGEQERRRAQAKAAEQDAYARDMRDGVRAAAVTAGRTANELEGALRNVERSRERGELRPLTSNEAQAIASYRERFGVGARGELVVGTDGLFVMSDEVATEQARRAAAWLDRYETEWRIERCTPDELARLRGPLQAKLEAAQAEGTIRTISPEEVKRVEVLKAELAGRQHRELADRFLRSSPAERMADPALRSAQQQYVRIVSGWIGSRDPVERAGDVRGFERELADVLVQGRTLKPADVSQADEARVRGERFRVLTPEQRAADPQLRNAQGQLSAFSWTLNERVVDPAQRAAILEAAEAEITGRLAAGETFKAPLVQEVERSASVHAASEPSTIPRKRDLPERER